MKINYLSRIYQFIFDKLKCRTLADPAYLLVRSMFRFRYLIRRKKCESLMDKTTAEKMLNDLYARPEHRNYQAGQQEYDGTDLTVIIPVYNAEKYIESCILSIAEQKTEFSLEIIAVDDGSKDNSGKILDKLAAGYSCIKVFHRENKGAPAARNFGLDNAHGFFIMFADADDILLPGAVDALMKAAKKENADFVQGSWKYENGPVQKFPNIVKDSENRKEIIEIPGMPWGKVIRRSLLTDIRFPEGYTSYEDSPIKCLVFRRSNRIALIDSVVYSWRRNPEGITFSSKNNPRSIQTYWICEEMNDEAERLGFPEDDLYKMILINQLTPIAVGRIDGLAANVQKAVFALCREMACAKIKDTDAEKMPYAQKQAYAALKDGDFESWRYIGNKWNYIL